MHIYPIDLIFKNNFKECEDVLCCISATVLGDYYNLKSYNFVYIYEILFYFVSSYIAVFVKYMVAYIRIHFSNYWEYEF